MAFRKIYKTSEEALEALFALPSDEENSDDDVEGTSDEGDMPDDRELDGFDLIDDDADDSDDDDVLYQLASSQSSPASSFADTDDSEEDENGWSKREPGRQPVDFDSVTVVPRKPFTLNEGPLEFFQNLFDDNTFAWLVQQTNLYAAQTRMKHWNDVNMDEMKAFIGLLIGMGLHQLPRIELYWSSDPVFRVQPFADVMPVKRFKKIRQALHANDNSKTPKKGEPMYDKLYKVRPLLDMINMAFRNNAVPSSSQSVDEAMIKFKGRSSLKQYMPLKPIKRGYKVWVRADSRTGYAYEFDIYTGRRDDGDASVGLGAQVVQKLCSTLNGSSTHVAFDNFFSSFELLETLYSHRVYSTATVRSNRKDLPVIAREKTVLKKGEFDWRCKQNTSYVRWRDTKDVHVISTAFIPTENRCVRRTQKDGSALQVPCPEAIVQYTNRMGGVDRFDEKRGRYSVSRRCTRWWMRIFYFLIDSCIVNAFILFSSVHPHDMMTVLQFRRTLFSRLVGTFTSRCRRSSVDGASFVRRSSSHKANPAKPLGVPEEVRTLSVGMHMPERLDNLKRCRLCSSRKNNKRSRIKCSTCNVALCITPCFGDFHK